MIGIKADDEYRAQMREWRKAVTGQEKRKSYLFNPKINAPQNETIEFKRGRDYERRRILKIIMALTRKGPLKGSDIEGLLETLYEGENQPLGTKTNKTNLATSGGISF
jgi:hypothetical protein